MITKTKFKEYSRCPRFASLDRLKKEKENALIDSLEYASEFYMAFLDDEEFLEDITDEQLEVMMPYFSRLEAETAKIIKKQFSGDVIYSLETRDQQYFERWNENYQFSCYIDAYVSDDKPKVIEVKATTSSKLKDFTYKYKKEEHPLFVKVNNIYKRTPPPEDELELEKYANKYAKLFDRYDGLGKYVFDLAIQEWIVSGASDLKHDYYLAVLNHNYVYDGHLENGEVSYEAVGGEELVTFIDLTDVVEEYHDQIQSQANQLESTLDALLIDPVDLGKHCERKKTTQCSFFDTCWKDIPKENSIFTYMNSHHGFGEKENKKYPFELIKEGITNMLDIPESMLTREANIIQRRVHKTHQPEYFKQKIIDGIDTLTFPLYHLDFESFPCPLPRFHGEKPYTQSVFQFSLHIQKDMDSCDKELDHIEFCSHNLEDDRLELIKAMVEGIGPVGDVIVWNQGFEKARLKELAEIFPEYKKELMEIRERVFDLMYLFKSNKAFYQELGYSDAVASLFNFYHEDLQGSFSIKKVLPIFSELTYKGMTVGNGMEAVITYAKFPFMDVEEFKFKYHALLEYCKQDTWAMVELLQELNHLVQKK